LALSSHINWLTREQMSAGTGPRLSSIDKSCAITVKAVAAIPMIYAAIAHLERFERPERIILLGSGSRVTEPGILDSNIATKSNENDMVGVEQLVYVGAFSSPAQYPQRPTA
jgi:hypothetical protein